MIRCAWRLLRFLFLAASIAASAQPPQTVTSAAASAPADDPVANPGRPTVSTPATLTPAGYFQFETGILGAWQSPELSSQVGLNEVVKFSVSRWIELLAATQPFEHSVAEGQTTNGFGGVALGVQGIVHHGNGAQPTVAVAYFGVVYDGGLPNLDVGSFSNSVALLASADIKGFHYDTNFFFNEVTDGAVRRAQFGQTLSVSHPVGKNFVISGEIWHFTQPFLHSNAVGNLWALSYNVRKTLVLDCGFNRGLTSTSTQWIAVAGFTYLLPHKVRLR